MAARRFTLAGAAAHHAGVLKRGRQISAAADARAHALAPLVKSIIGDGYVLPSEIAAQLTSRGEARPSATPWTSNSARTLLQRMIALGLVVLPEIGPYGDKRYSSIPRRSDVDAVRKANAEHADSHALAFRPIIHALQAQGFTKLKALTAELNRRSIAPQRGDAWTVGSLRNLLNRLKDMQRRGRV